MQRSSYKKDQGLIVLHADWASEVNKSFYYMTCFTGTLSHAYNYGNHWKYPTVFRKFWKCLKTVSYAFLEFWKLSKNLRKSSELFWKFRKISEKIVLTVILRVLKISEKSTTRKPVRIRAYMARGPNTHFKRLRVNQSECRKLQGRINSLIDAVHMTTSAPTKCVIVIFPLNWRWVISDY